MTKIDAVLIDRREPDWVQRLTFDGAPVAITELETGDVQVACDDGCILVIERKTPDDFFGSLADDRMFLQAARMVEQRIDEQAVSETLHWWPYLVIAGKLERSRKGKCVTERGETAWDWSAMQGALLTIQEMGVFTTICGEDDFEACVMRLAGRKREPVVRLLPARPPSLLGPGAAVLASLPGIGVERVINALAWGGTVAQTLSGLTDLSVKGPEGIGPVTREKIRSVLGLKQYEALELTVDASGQEKFIIEEKQQHV